MAKLRVFGLHPVVALIIGAAVFLFWKPLKAGAAQIIGKLRNTTPATPGASQTEPSTGAGSTDQK